MTQLDRRSFLRRSSLLALEQAGTQQFEKDMNMPALGRNMED